MGHAAVLVDRNRAQPTSQAGAAGPTKYNSAGISSTLAMRPFDQIPLEEWERVLRVNLTGPFLRARAVLPATPRAEVPEDLVGAVLFLASDASAFVSGQSINLDGGVTPS